MNLMFEDEQRTTVLSENQVGSTESNASSTAAEGIEAQQFKQWFENYLKQCMLNISLFHLSFILFVYFRSESFGTTIISIETPSEQCGKLLLYSRK